MRPTTDHDPRRAIASGRAYRGQTQAELAEALSEELGETWTQAMVTKLEKGRKRLEVEVLMAIARIHQLPYSFYLEGPDGNTARGVYLSSLEPAAA